MPFLVICIAFLLRREATPSTVVADAGTRAQHPVVGVPPHDDVPAYCSIANTKVLWRSLPSKPTRAAISSPSCDSNYLSPLTSDWLTLQPASHGPWCGNEWRG